MKENVAARTEIRQCELIKALQCCQVIRHYARKCDPYNREISEYDPSNISRHAFAFISWSERNT